MPHTLLTAQPASNGLPMALAHCACIACLILLQHYRPSLLPPLQPFQPPTCTKSSSSTVASTWLHLAGNRGIDSPGCCWLPLLLLLLVCSACMCAAGMTNSASSPLAMDPRAASRPEGSWPDPSWALKGSAADAEGDDFDAAAGTPISSLRPLPAAPSYAGHVSCRLNTTCRKKQPSREWMRGTTCAGSRSKTATSCLLGTSVSNGNVSSACSTMRCIADTGGRLLRLHHTPACMHAGLPACWVHGVLCQ